MAERKSYQIEGEEQARDRDEERPDIFLCHQLFTLLNVTIEDCRYRLRMISVVWNLI